MAGANLTREQWNVLEFLETYIEQHGWAPTVRELQELLHYASPSTVHLHLQSLERRGYIERRKGVGQSNARALRILDREAAA